MWCIQKSGNLPELYSLPKYQSFKKCTKCEIVGYQQSTYTKLKSLVTVIGRLAKPSWKLMFSATQSGFQPNSLQNSENWLQLKACPFLHHFPMLVHSYY